MYSSLSMPSLSGAASHAMRWLATCTVALSAGLAQAASTLPETPLPWLELDVPYVVTPDDVVTRMLDMAEVGKGDYLIDLGSGDGRIPIAAVRDRQAVGAMGVEIVPDLVDKAKQAARQAKVSDRVSFRVQDLFDTDLTQASVITMYLLPDVNMKLRPSILQLTPGTRVVSHAFDMGDWESDDSTMVGKSRLFLWIVPAQVKGDWRMDVDGDAWQLQLWQEFQRVGGTLVRDGRTLPIESGIVRGNDVQFSVRDGGKVEQYLGRLVGSTLVGLSVDSDRRHWRATRP